MMGTVAHWLNRILARPAPSSSQASTSHQVKQRRYDGASAAARLTGWSAPGTDATSAIDRPSLLRNRARDLVRNNPWAAKGVQALTNNTIGWGIRAKWPNSKAQGKWTDWAERTDCDASGMHNFYGLQQLAFRAMVESGEVIIRLRPRRTEDGLAAPLQLQIMESDHLYEGLDGRANGGNTINRGIEYDPLGRRVAYYLYRTHPGSSIRALRTDWGAYSRVPADEVIHLYRKDRPDQERGVSWLAPVILTLRELDLYEDAYLKRQQLANMHAAFVTVEEGTVESAEDIYTNLHDGLQPGSFYLLRPGRDVAFNTPPAADDYGPYTMETLRRVASGLGITFEALTGNLSQVNFSSARMGWQEMGRNIDAWRWTLFVPQFCDTVARWFAQATLVTGSPAWTAPARTLVDPTREIPAIVDSVRSGLMSLSEAIRQQGYDPEQLLSEMKSDAERLDLLGLVLDSDPRQQARAKALPTEPPNDNP